MTYAIAFFLMTLAIGSPFVLASWIEEKLGERGR
jgi:hypothetical protein